MRMLGIGWKVCGGKEAQQLRRRMALTAVLLSLAVSACTSSIKVSLVASDNINPGGDGKPLSVVVRVYQLAGKDQFEKTDFLTLAKADERVLGKDILLRKEVTLLPGATEVLKEDRKEGAEYVGVMALFREGDQVWRRVIALKDLWIKSVTFYVNHRTVSSDK